MKRIVFVFIDGIGLGPDNGHNPFFKVSLPGFEQLSGSRPWGDHFESHNTDSLTARAIDATLGLPGLPQSGTGQASLFTGVNCAKIAGRHFGPFPHSASRAVLAEKNIFSQIQSAGKHVAFLNAYPPIFFELAEARDRWPVTTRSCLESSTRIRTLDDLARGEALAADLTSAGLKKRFDPEIEPISEIEAAERLAAVSDQHSFSLFEYFLTDRAGHRQSMEEAAVYLKSLDRFLAQLISCVDRTGTTLIVTSDHGNLEDLSVKTHTRNDVPFIANGPLAEHFHTVESLTDVVPAILRALSI